MEEVSTYVVNIKSIHCHGELAIAIWKIDVCRWKAEKTSNETNNKRL